MPDRLYGATLMGGRMAPVLSKFGEHVRDMHAVTDAKVVFGHTDIDRGSNPIAVLIALFFGFPAGGRSLPTVITIVSDGANEIWHRRFAGHPILTRLGPGSLRRTGVIERFRFGVAFDLDVVERDGRLQFTVVAMSVCGVPMPRWLWPVLKAEERSEADGFRFDIDIAMPWIGKLIHYHGWVGRAGRRMQPSHPPEGMTRAARAGTRPVRA